MPIAFKVIFIVLSIITVVAFLAALMAIARINKALAQLENSSYRRDIH